MSGSHTPTPWKVSPGHAEGAVTIRQDGGEFQRPVAEVWHNGDDPKANAEFIVTAVNSHASSQAEIERLTLLLNECVKQLDMIIDRGEPTDFIQWRAELADALPLNAEGGDK